MNREIKEPWDEKSKEYGIGMVNTLFSGSYLGYNGVLYRGTFNTTYITKSYGKITPLMCI